jgi:hypothetical protein
MDRAVVVPASLTFQVQAKMTTILETELKYFESYARS